MKGMIVASLAASGALVGLFAFMGRIVGAAWHAIDTAVIMDTQKLDLATKQGLVTAVIFAVIFFVGFIIAGICAIIFAYKYAKKEPRKLRRKIRDMEEQHAKQITDVIRTEESIEKAKKHIHWPLYPYKNKIRFMIAVTNDRHRQLSQLFSLWGTPYCMKCNGKMEEKDDDKGHLFQCVECNYSTMHNYDTSKTAKHAEAKMRVELETWAKENPEDKQRIEGITNA